MDKKKKITTIRLFIVYALLACLLPSYAQSNREIAFRDYTFDTIPGGDSITLFVSFVDENGNKISNTTLKDLSDYTFYEDGKAIESDRIALGDITTGKRIPKDCTFSVLVDLNIPESGKRGIFETVRNLVESAPDSCVYLSFFGDEVTSSRMVTRQNIMDFERSFMRSSTDKYFYGAVFSKLSEFSFINNDQEQFVKKEAGYVTNKAYYHRALKENAKNYLFIFTEGTRWPTQEEHFSYANLVEFHRDTTYTPKPKIYAFYYTENAVLDEDVENALVGLTTNAKIPPKYRGLYCPSNNLDTVLYNFQELVNDAMYDYSLKYKATEDKSYKGLVHYSAKTGQNERGKGDFSIGTSEQGWPIRKENVLYKYLMAALIALLTIAFFFLIIKILIPGIKSKAFAVKYYKKYVPEENVQVRNCHYCKQPILPGQTVVTRCKHIMHVDCWQQNGYKCAEYGQNCKEGIQEHINWSDLFNSGSLRDFYLTMEGILAGFASWIIYSLFSQKPFTGFARGILNTFIKNNDMLNHAAIMNNCEAKISSFLLIGLLLAFFMSIIFRYNDGAKKTDWKSLLKLFGLSVLSAIIGMAAFLVGSVIFCWMMPSSGIVDIDLWYYSFPAYLLFSICTSLSLTIKSTIPIKSALLGGIFSAVIGFLVLYFSNFTSARNEWMDMFLNFCIYGGGLGASLVTVRMLAEKYYLVIKNGVRAGQRIPIHKWMNATGGGNIVTIGMTERCEIQMTWEKSNKVAKEHVQLYVDHSRSQAMLRPLVPGVLFNTRTDLPVGKATPLNNTDTFCVGDTIFQYIEN